MADDLEHRDWLLISQKHILRNINPNIIVDIYDTYDGGKRLHACNITEDDINKLAFITNTDENNNYLYIENFQVYLDNSLWPSDIPGLFNVVENMFQCSDASSFIKETTQKLHYPFNLDNIKNAPNFTGTDFNQYVDFYSGSIPFTVSTSSHVKTYKIILNPDAPLEMFQSKPEKKPVAKSLAKVVSSYTKPVAKSLAKVVTSYTKPVAKTVTSVASGAKIVTSYANPVTAVTSYA